MNQPIQPSIYSRCLCVIFTAHRLRLKPGLGGTVLYSIESLEKRANAIDKGEIDSDKAMNGVTEKELEIYLESSIKHKQYAQSEISFDDLFDIFKYVIL